MNKILVVEDNAAMREMLVSILEEKGYIVKEAPEVSTALLLLKKEAFSVILSDLQMPGMDGLSFLKRVKGYGIPFIMITAFGSIEEAVEAMKSGAFDFISKPVDPEYLFLIIQKALESTRIIRENLLFKEVNNALIEKSAIIGDSPAIKQEAEKISKAAPTRTPILLLGESGTGKELFARAIHRLSDRKDKPFIALNSASIPENLLENELFGHEKGSYTDAHIQQIGKLELAQGGTFFLDEIGDLPFRLQGKLLRVIEEKSISRIGGSQEIHLDIRFVFATNVDLEQSVRNGHFRKDLYFRISVFPIKLPPLRERKGDLEILTRFFIRKFCLEMNCNQKIDISDAALSKLSGYHWPGNIRELSNTMERAVILCLGDRIEEGDIILPEAQLKIEEEISLKGTLKAVTARAVRFVEKKKIEQILLQCDSNKMETAKKLEISYKTLLEKVKEYEIGKEN